MQYAILMLVAGWFGYQLGKPSAGKATAPQLPPLSKSDALQILGLEDAATSEDVNRAYQTLIKKLHPDAGGSSYLAKLVIEAKKVLNHE